MNVHEYGTHIPALFYSLAMSQGDVLELGSGAFSTSLIHCLCARQETPRHVLTVDEDPKWLGMFAEYVAPWHDLFCIQQGKWDAFFKKIKDWRFGVVFVDCELPEAVAEAEGYTVRKKLCYLLKQQADIIVIHDSEDPSFRKDDKWNEFVASFKFVAEDKTTGVHTLVLSDKFNVGVIIKQGWRF